MISFKKIVLAIFVVKTAVLSTFAADNMDDLFSYENETFAGCSLNYRKAELFDAGDSTKVVVLFLHGGSGQGDDNKSQMTNPAIANVYNYLKDRGFNALMLVPQAPYGQQWTGTMLPALKALTDKYADSGCEIYILGGSMGGSGVWNMLTTYPAYFAGAMPVACNTPKASANKYAGTRIYSVVGGNDRKRKISTIQSFFKKLTEKGVATKLDVENSWGHRQTCEWSFTPARLGWLFGKTHD